MAQEKKQETKQEVAPLSREQKMELGIIESIADFKRAMDDRRSDFEDSLPEHVPFERFRAVAVEAVRQNPELVTKCTPRSLFGAFAKAATDGLMPDAREGVITPYKSEAQWNPMIYGLRKRAEELGDYLVQAVVVYANDDFVWSPSEEPECQVKHTATPLGEDRGKVCGAYAVFRKDGRVRHVEVMDFKELETVRQQSKQPNSPMWKTFTGEGYKKVVARRGFKSVPVSPELDRIIRRNDDEYDFDQRPQVAKPKEPTKSVSSIQDQLAGGAMIEDGVVIDGEIIDSDVQIQIEALQNGLSMCGSFGALAAYVKKVKDTVLMMVGEDLQACQSALKKEMEKFDDANEFSRHELLMEWTPAIEWPEK